MLRSRVALSVLLVLNVIVLLGQIWPAGAPPFARGVNIAFLASSLAYFLGALGAARRTTSAPATPDRDRSA
jgi:hypothetical protein